MNYFIFDYIKFIFYIKLKEKIFYIYDELLLIIFNVYDIIDLGIGNHLKMIHLCGQMPFLIGLASELAFANQMSFLILQ